jgi:hydroxymethylpyrimidine/phosphomethylpyrimidine kinase
MRIDRGMSAPPRILAIAGSDSSGGAGIQADIKTITMLGGYAMTAITAVTAQNTMGVQAVEVLSGEFVLEQMASCIEDIGVDAIKIGMLGSEDIVRHVAGGLVAAPEIGARSSIGHARKDTPPDLGRFPIVVDPVMVATSGALLADTATIEALKARLLPLATLVTPNLPELEVLSGKSFRTLQDVKDVAAELAATYSCHFLVKGGHGVGSSIHDILVAPDGTALSFEHARIETQHTHGTGCTLSAAAATCLGKGLSMGEAFERAVQFVVSAIEAAPGFGFGKGPMGHHAIR